MAIKKIIKVWDEEGLINNNIDFLLKKTKKVYFPLTSSSEQIIEDLHETYKEIACAGIAANQIGYDKSIFIGLKDYNDELDEDDIEEKESKYDENSLEKNDNANNFDIYINPQIDKIDEKSIQTEIEGCLSLPLLSLRVERYDKIRVRYYDKTGKAIKRSLKGFMSKLFQHELDHLNGKIMLQKDVIEGFSEEDSFITPELYEQLKSRIS